MYIFFGVANYMFIGKKEKKKRMKYKNKKRLKVDYVSVKYLYYILYKQVTIKRGIFSCKQQLYLITLYLSSYRRSFCYQCNVLLPVQLTCYAQYKFIDFTVESL